MKRKIELYIADRKVDLDSEAIILFNYTQDDLSNPAVVRNSYSCAVTLQGTPTNNAIFGDVFRLDRQTQVSTAVQNGVAFDPLRKTPFAIYDERGDILESGYVKLDSVKRKGQTVEYSVTLYGGLGSFLYGLSYNAAGESISLADLDYLGSGDPAELDFIINAATVLQAWSNDYEETAGKWQVINFAPAYNGYPDGEFSPDKGLFVPSLAGAADTVTKDGKVYGTAGARALFSLPNPVDEWAAKDLRSYLQRPVIRVKAILNAIRAYASEIGFTFDYSDIADPAKFEYYNSLNLTLPLLPSLGTYKQVTGPLAATLTSDYSAGPTVGSYTIGGLATIPAGSKVEATLNMRPAVHFATAPGVAKLYQTFWQRYGAPGNTVRGGSVAFIQAVAVDSSNVVIGAGPVCLLDSTLPGFPSVQAAANTLGFNGYVTTENQWGQVIRGEWNRYAGSSEVYRYSANVPLSISVNAGTAIDHIDVRVWSGTYLLNGAGTIVRPGTVADALIRLGEGLTVDDDPNFYNPDGMALDSGTGTDVVTYTSTAKIRSGATVTKQMLLSAAGTPAAFLLSLAKTFGLYFLYDRAERKVTLLRRNTLYQDETIDLTGRVDTHKDITVVPFVFDKKWYDFQHPTVGGEFSDLYKSIQGREYGSQRVNTGFEFNAEIENVLKDTIFKSAVTVLESGRYWNILATSALFYPSPFLDSGVKYTLRASDGSTTEETFAGVPNTVVPQYYNEYGHEGYDIEGSRKLQLHDADGKPVDGAGILVIEEGWDSYSAFKVTDDLPEMDTLNGKPCWILDSDPEDELRVPSYQRYSWRSGVPGWTVDLALDFGVPAEMDIPGVEFPEASALYSKAWKAYMRDRYDRDTKVMRCYVNLSGLQVGQNLLRKFYYYEGALWVLNKISNYSLTTFDLAECEFVKVKDKANYLTGQNL